MSQEQKSGMTHEEAKAWMRSYPRQVVTASGTGGCSWRYNEEKDEFEVEDCDKWFHSNDFNDRDDREFSGRTYTIVGGFGWPDEQPKILTEATPDPIKPEPPKDYTAVQPGPGVKFDSNKNRLDLVPVETVEAVAEVLTYGAKKYSANNWQNVEQDRYYAALLRHLFAWRRGETRDPESGFLHLQHVATNAIFLLWFALRAEKKS